MNWEQVCADPILQSLPYKMELNQWGEIVMSPVSVRHTRFQRKIQILLESLLSDGEALAEFPVETPGGIRVPDVAWLSHEQLFELTDAISSFLPPAICVEVLSPGNTKQEMIAKQELYFQIGVKEVWICDQEGMLLFYDGDKELPKSQIVFDFPSHIKL